ncbi:MAG: hypothetical protein EBZ31_04270, partial [Flavobacteriia bacterium]|nr:hypothetical protein [Flavobacteriia bacterium]
MGGHARPRHHHRPARDGSPPPRYRIQGKPPSNSRPAGESSGTRHREKHLYEALVSEVAESLASLQATATALCDLDVLACFAERAAALNLCRPRFTDNTLLQIEGGRHPVVEAARDVPFIANDTQLDHNRRMLLITGPNMGGKSTYMRQNALIALLAHVGAFVPAQAVSLSCLDRIFTRIGSSDDL